MASLPVPVHAYYVSPRVSTVEWALLSVSSLALGLKQDGPFTTLCVGSYGLFYNMSALTICRRGIDCLHGVANLFYGKSPSPMQNLCLLSTC